jgi:signal transduction histidine kinase
MVLFRVVQEALNNSIKHAKTKKISVRLNYEPTRFSISIIDHGVGFDFQGLEQSKKELD